MSSEMSPTTPTKAAYDEEAATGTASHQRRASVMLTDAQFEKLYFTPGGQSSKGDLAMRLGNPTAFSLAVFALPLTPFGIALMGWGDVTQAALIPIVGAFLLCGGLGLVLGGLMEWVCGNTFPSTVFMTFAGLYLSIGFALQPAQGIAAALGADLLDYYVGLAYYIFGWGFCLMIFGVCAMRTNLAFISIFAFITPACWVLGAGYYVSGKGMSHAHEVFQAAGALLFVSALAAWYNLAAIMFLLTDFPVKLPVGDMSHFLRKPAAATAVPKQD